MSRFTQHEYIFLMNALFPKSMKKMYTTELSLASKCFKPAKNGLVLLYKSVQFGGYNLIIIDKLKRRIHFHNSRGMDFTKEMFKMFLCDYNKENDRYLITVHSRKAPKNNEGAFMLQCAEEYIKNKQLPRTNIEYVIRKYRSILKVRKPITNELKMLSSRETLNKNSFGKLSIKKENSNNQKTLVKKYNLRKNTKKTTFQQFF